MQHFYARNVTPNHNCQAKPLYQHQCVSNDWSTPTQKIVDLRSLINSPAIDQGILNSCTGCAISAAVEITLNREDKSFECDSGMSSDASAMFIYYYERVEENKELENLPVFISDGFDVLIEQGVCCDHYWPYPENHLPPELMKVAKSGTLEEIMAVAGEITQHKAAFIEKAMAMKPSAKAIKQAQQFTSAKFCKLSIDDNLQEVKHALSNQTPVIFGFNVPQALFNLTPEAMMPLPKADEVRIGGHAVCAIGYDDEKQALLIRNSYGVDFGDQGYFYMPYEFILGSYLEGEEWQTNTYDFYCLLKE